MEQEKIARRRHARGPDSCDCTSIQIAQGRTLREAERNASACKDDQCRYCEEKLYTGLSAEHLRELRRCLTNFRMVPRELLFLTGDPCTWLYVIREGQVKLTRIAADGQEHVLNLAGPGYFLGFDTIGNATYSYSAETLTPTVVCRVKHDDIVRLLTDAPRVSLNILLAINEQLAQARNMIRALGQKGAVEKVAALLLALFPPHAGNGDEAGALHLSRQEMAEILGLTVETVSRIMAALRRKKIVHAPRGRILVSDRARLRVLAGNPLFVDAPDNSRRGAKPPRRRERNHGQNLRLS